METNNTQNINRLTQFHAITDSLLEGLLIIDFNWHLIYVNHAICKQISMPKEVLIGQNIKDKWPNIDNTGVFKMLEDCMVNRNRIHLENEFTFNDASKKWFELIIKPDEEGICVLSLDITQHKISEQKTQKISRLYAFISQVNQNIVRVKDDKVLFANSCKIAVTFGKFKIAWIGLLDETTGKIALVEQNGIISKDVEQIYLIENDPTQKKVIETGAYFICNDIQNHSELINWKPFIRDHAVRSCIILPIKKLDEIIGTFNLYSTDLAFFDEEEIKLVVEVAGDISFALDRFEKAKQHKRNEEIILHNEKRFRGLIENSNDVIALCNKKGKFIYGSPNFEKTLGYSTNEYLKLSAFTVMHPEKLKDFSEKVKTILLTPEACFYYQQKIKHKNGKWIWCEGKITNMMHLEGVKAIVINFRDISQRKIAEDKLLQKNEELQKINFELDRFVYSVSHDLRSPLTSVLGLLSFIQEDSKEPETLLHVKMIHDSIDHLDEFIKNILSYSRNNRMELQIEKIPLQQKIEKIMNSLHYMKEAENINFEINISQECDFYSDKQSFSTIIENIISNAIKFQDKNKPKQYIKITGSNKDDYLNLEISDNGIGIATENYTKIFDMFVRLSSDINGTGIGLYIVKEIVTKIEGSITIESIIGKETTFKIKLKNLKPC